MTLSFDRTSVLAEASIGYICRAEAEILTLPKSEKDALKEAAAKGLSQEARKKLVGAHTNAMILAYLSGKDSALLSSSPKDHRKILKTTENVQLFYKAFQEISGKKIAFHTNGITDKDIYGLEDAGLTELALVIKEEKDKRSIPNRISRLKNQIKNEL